MPMNDEDEERGALVLRQGGPVYGRMYGRIAVLVSDAFTFEVSETKEGVRLDFRRRTLLERIEVWRRKWGR